MANTRKEPTALYTAFTNYNRYISDLGFYENWLDAKKYRGLNDAALSTLMNNYYFKLSAKTKIDKILNRKSEIKKNKEHLAKLNTICQKLNIQLSESSPQFDDEVSSIAPPTSTEHSNQAKGIISDVNRTRLAIMGYRFLIDFFYTTNNFTCVSEAVSCFNGYASYLFYFTRGLLEFGKLVKHTVSDYPELKNNNNINTKEKLILQIGLRYGILINDSLWGVINFLTYHILIGTGSLGYLGNVLTIALLLSDIIVSIYNLHLAQRKYNAFIEELNNLNLKDTDKNKILKDFQQVHDKKIRDLKWSIIFSGIFCLGFLVFLNFLIPGPNLSVIMPPQFMLIGALLVVVLQWADVLRDTYYKFKEAGDSKDLKQIAMIEGVSRFLQQIIIPGLMLLSGVLISAVPALSSWFFFLSMMLVAFLVIQAIRKTTEYLTLNREISHLEKEISHLEKEISHLERNTNNPYKAEDTAESKQKLENKKAALKSSESNIKDHLINSGIALSSVTILGMALIGASSIIAIPVAILMISIILRIIPNKENKLELESMKPSGA